MNNILDLQNFIKTNKHICPFCKNNLPITIDNKRIRCMHGNIEIAFVENMSIIYYTLLIKDNLYYYDIYVEDNISELISHIEAEKILYFNPALILSPEQFVKKLPFLLNFQ